MPHATMTSKGQVTVPKEVRDDLGLHAGSRLSFTRNADGTYTLSRRSTNVLELAGILGSAQRHLTIEDMADAVAREAIARAGLTRAGG